MADANLSQFEIVGEYVFFFQAEDGIRDHCVTGVQTCALPIYVGGVGAVRVLLVMQSLDAAMRLRPKRRLLGGGVRLQTEQDPNRPNPTYIPAAEAAARWFAERTGGRIGRARWREEGRTQARAA